MVSPLVRTRILDIRMEGVCLGIGSLAEDGTRGYAASRHPSRPQQIASRRAQCCIFSATAPVPPLHLKDAGRSYQVMTPESLLVPWARTSASRRT